MLKYVALVGLCLLGIGCEHYDPPTLTKDRFEVKNQVIDHNNRILTIEHLKTGRCFLFMDGYNNGGVLEVARGVCE